MMDDPIRISRSKIELFTNCPRCFWLDQVKGVKRPSFPAFTLNSAVDRLLKQEFNILRVRGEQHPLQKKYKIDAIPVSHEKLEDWTQNFKGVQYLHKPSNLLIFGAIDDLWINSKGEFIVVDYKATSREGQITKLDDTRWHAAYRRQMEVYQWLLRKNGLKVSDIGYFVYCNGLKDKKAFDGKLEFDVTLISNRGDDSWVEKTIQDIKKSLRGKIPEVNQNCEYCSYVQSASEE